MIVLQQVYFLPIIMTQFLLYKPVMIMLRLLLLLGWCSSTVTATSYATQRSESPLPVKEESFLNDMILMDSIQINPGDTYIGQQQGSKYSDPYYLKRRGYTARSSSMEQSPALCMTYRRADRVKTLLTSSSSSNTDTNDGVFQNHRNSSVWVSTYCQGIHRMMNETLEAGLEIFFFTDMIVFPIALMELYPEVMHMDHTTQKVTIVYNNYTEYLIQIMLDEWMETFPLTSGIVVRTGETYTFDTPYHTGSSPIAAIHNVTEQNQIWVQYIQWLRQILCVRYHKKVIFRTWFSITDVTSYIDITDQVRPHRLLYFSVKHTSGDFFRQMSPNALLQMGQHAQIIEIQIQREYEGKGAYPLYLFEHIVFGDISSGSNRSLSQLFPNGCNTTTTSSTMMMKGIWTWSRGGGWWGPYLHGAEFWIDVNLHMFLAWWNQDHCTTTMQTIHDLFQNVCIDILQQQQLGFGNPYGTVLHGSMNHTVVLSLNEACTDLRRIMLLADQALLYGRYCLEAKGAYSNCWIWTRDDRMGGINELQAHMNYLRDNATRITESLWYKQQSLVLWEEARLIYDTNVSSTFARINPRIDRQIHNSFLYAQSYFCIIESAWRALIYGTLLTNDSQHSNHTLLTDAISDYDAGWNKFRAIGLTTPEFPSLYKGTYWNFPFEKENEGMDATINRLRKFVLFNSEEINTSFK